MELKLTNLEISNIMHILERITQKDLRGVRLKYRIGKIVKDLNPHHEDYMKARRELIEEYAEKDEEGNFKRPEDEEGNVDNERIMLKDPEEFDQKAKSLSTDEISLSLSTRINVQDLENESVDLNVPELITLQPILTEDA